VATAAFDLNPPIRYVIHAVGPVWDGGGYGEAEVLTSCYQRILAVADQLRVRSLAIPAIATGIYGFPSPLAARIAVGTIRSTPSRVELVRLMAFDDLSQEALEAALARE
jgi:O-acetyl-ADP-ribose deacetylase (regulator of RNase III)